MSGPAWTGKGATVSNWKWVDLHKKDIFCNEDDETLEQVVQTSCVCLIPGNIQGQDVWDCEQPDLVKYVSAYDRGRGLDDLYRSL